MDAVTLALSKKHTESISSAAQPLLQKMYHNISDVNLVVLGDSTGNETTEWVYLLAQNLASSYPAYTVKYYLWDDPTKAYPATPITIQTGTGSNTLNVWNASVAGMYSYYPIQNGFITQVVTPNPDLVIISHGHNETITVDVDKWNTRARLYLLGQYVTARVPSASVMMIAQNPETTNDYQKQRAEMVAEIAMKCGFGYVNVHDAFLAQPNWSTTLMADTVHPNALGHSKVWVPEVMKHFKYVSGFRPTLQAPSSLTVPSKNLITNGDFSAFTTATPDNWTATGTPTLSKDLTNFETGTYGLKMVSVASTQSYIQQDVNTLSGLNVNFFKGKWVTLAVRLRKPTGQVTTAGRIAINDGVTTVTSRASYAGDGAFYWDVVSMKIADNATRVRVYLYADTGTTGNVEVTVDRAILCTGILPRDMF